MKRKLLKKVAVMLFMGMGFSNLGFAQNIGDFRSKGSGIWGGGSVDGGNLVVGAWETYDGITWVDAIANPGNTTDVTIRNGHTITLDGTKSANSLIIEQGGTLKSVGGSIRNMRIVTLLDNNGKFGDIGSNERVSIEAYGTSGITTVKSSNSTGVFKVGLFRVNGVAQNLEVIIDADLDMSQYLAALYTTSSSTNNSASQGDDNVTITLKEGRTINPTYIHHNSGSEIATDFYGNYTYNINGTLDMSQSGTSSIFPAHSSNENSTVTINVNGTFKIGNAIRSASSVATAKGKVFINVGNTGLIDATARSGSNLVMNTGSDIITFFNIIGNGKVRINPSSHSSQRTIRVGSNGNYSPIVLPSTLAAAIDVNVKDVDAGAKQMIKKVYTLEKYSGDLSPFDLSLGAISVDAVNSFNAEAPKIYRWSGSSWDNGETATKSGTGLISDPYLFSVVAQNTLGIFGVANETPATLPLKFVSFTATPSKSAKQVLLNWTTAEEKDVLDFVIERSTDGINFSQIGRVEAKNVSGTNYYRAVDNNPYQGVAYYRVRQRDFDGTSGVSKIEYVNMADKIALNVYPNPVINNLMVTHPLASTGVINVYSLEGKKVVTNEVQVGSSSTGLDVSTLSPAIYLLEAKVNGETYSQKFSKE